MEQTRGGLKSTEPQDTKKPFQNSARRSSVHYANVYFTKKQMNLSLFVSYINIYFYFLQTALFVGFQVRKSRK